LVEDGKYNEAIPCCNSAGRQSGNHRGTASIGNCTGAQRKRYSEAIPALKKAIELVPDARAGPITSWRWRYLKNWSVAGIERPYFEVVAKNAQSGWTRNIAGSVYARIKRCLRP